MHRKLFYRGYVGYRNSLNGLWYAHRVIDNGCPKLEARTAQGLRDEIWAATKDMPPDPWELPSIGNRQASSSIPA